MEITLSNDGFQACISSSGAQLLSFKNRSTGVEHIWNGNPQVWKFRAPILFPIVSRLKDGYYLWQEKEYPLTNHGFARDLEHTVVESSATRVLWRLTDGEYTHKLFPWPFVLETEYRLEGSTLVFCTTVTNSGQEELSFSIGSHTGLVYPWAGSSKDDFVIRFEQQEVPDFVQVSVDGFPLGSWQAEENGQSQKKSFVPQTIPYPHITSGQIKLQDGFFASGHILTNFTSRWVALENTVTGDRGKVNTDGYPCLVLWQSPSEQHPFVCIEPWYGLPDCADTNHRWEEKAGLVTLQPGKSFTTNQSLTVDKI